MRRYLPAKRKPRDDFFDGVAAGGKPAVPHVHTSSLDFGQAWRYAVGIYGGRSECIGIDRHTTPLFTVLVLIPVSYIGGGGSAGDLDLVANWCI